MQAKRNALINEEHSLVAKMHQYKGVISPIRRLPPEIIGEIFLHFAPVFGTTHIPHDSGRRSVSKAEIPWYLGQICRYWRRVALSVRSLWSVYDLWSGFDRLYYNRRRYPCSYPSSQSDAEDSERRKLEAAEAHSLSIQKSSLIQQRLASVDMCLQRSGQAPISSRLIFCSTISGGDGAMFFKPLVACAPRLNHLVLVDLPPELLAQFSQSCAQYERLRRLAIVFTNATWSTPRLIFQCPALLTELTLSSLELSSTAQSCIPWSQLTKYCETDCTWEPSGHWSERKDLRWDSYRQLSDVVDLCVEFPTSTTITRPEDPVLLPKLEHARFSYEGRRSVLESFNMPDLQTLSYDHAQYSYWSWSEDEDEEAEEAERGKLALFRLPGPMPRLKILRLQVTKQPVTLFSKDILAQSPNLTEIFIDTPKLSTHDLLSTLIIQEDQAPVCSNLKVLRVGHLKLGEGVCEEIRQLIHGRFRDCNKESRMREFHLYDLDSDDECYSGIVEALTEYMDEGLPIFVETGGKERFAEGHLCH
ncbi:hypothetical protein DFH06DRAFT_46249 [Mycena polygramma]|nr:hypothetical protein DFH06DRAFT_46249 [Mycena polygramma]